MAAPLPARIAVVGTFYRHLPHQGDPLWRAFPARDGRWQRGETVEGLYLADQPETAWAEWYRGLAELALRPATALPRDLWPFEVRVDDVADLTSEEKLHAAGLGVPRPDRRTWPPYQDFGERLFREGYRGVLASSAARTAHQTLGLFRAQPSIPGVTPIRASASHRHPHAACAPDARAPGCQASARAAADLIPASVQELRARQRSPAPVGVQP